MSKLLELTDKYYDSKKWKKHAILVTEISEEIIECYESSRTEYISKLTDEEKFSIKLACTFHDVARKQGPKNDSKKEHASKGENIFKDDIWNDLKGKGLLKKFTKESRKKIKKFTAGAIFSHNNRKTLCSQGDNLIVSVCVYASDKIAHICKDKKVEAYCMESIKIHQLIKKIRKSHLVTPSLDLMCYCIVQVLTSKYPY